MVRGKYGFLRKDRIRNKHTGGELTGSSNRNTERILIEMIWARMIHDLDVVLEC